MRKTKDSGKWDEVFIKRFGGEWYPHLAIIAFTARYLQKRIGINSYIKRRKVRRILDAGCGLGRHVKFFSEQGFNVYGLDSSPQSIRIASAWLRAEKLQAKLFYGNLKHTPFPDKYFDVVVCYGVLDHIPFCEAKIIIQELKRTLSKKGYLYISLRSIRDTEFNRGKKIEKNAFILKQGYEKGIIQHYFNIDEINELLEGFKVFDIEIHEELFPQVYSLDKNYLQSSKMLKKYLNVGKNLKINLRSSRWHIVAEKAD